MSTRRLRALVARVTSEIRRDHPSLALLFIAPIIVTGLVTFILRESVTPAPVVALASDAGMEAAAVTRAIGAAVEAADMVVVEVEDGQDGIESELRSGAASVGILVPSDVASGGAITVVTLGTDPATEAAQLGQVTRAISEAAAAVAGRTLPEIERETVFETGDGDPINPFAPAIVAFFVYFFVYILTGVSFLRERTGGTLERLMATPVTRGEVVTGYTMGFGLFATVQVALLLAWALGTVEVPSIGPLPSFSIGLGINVAGSPLLAFLIVLLLALGAVSLGIFLSTFARTELQVIQFIPIVLAPQFLLSGVLFPVESLPAVLQPLVALMPLGYAVDGLRAVFIEGAGIESAAVQLDLAVLAGVALLFGVVATLTIRRDIA
jgi:ABC-2 type transport system permease protein